MLTHAHALAAGGLIALWISLVPAIAQEGISASVLIPCSITDMGDGGSKFFNVSKDSVSKQIVLTIRTDHGVATVNPKPYDYAGVSFSEITELEAIKRFGPAKKHVNFSTFDLWSNRAETNLFHLDLRFDSKLGKIAQYRVRGIGISKPIWTIPEN